MIGKTKEEHIGKREHARKQAEAKQMLLSVSLSNVFICIDDVQAVLLNCADRKKI